MQAAIGVDATTTSSSSSSTRRNKNSEDTSSVRLAHNSNRTATSTLRKHGAAVYHGQANNFNRTFLYDENEVDVVISSTLLSSSTSAFTTTNSNKIKSRIAFGSCNDQDRVNNLWKIIESRDPAAFIWGGDAIYADNKPLQQDEDDDNIMSYFDLTTIRDIWFNANDNMNSQNSLHHDTTKSTTSSSTSRSTCGTPSRVKKLYQDQSSIPDYKRLVESSNITIFGTIDDHDYGCNNADKTFEYKYETTNAFVEFLGEADSSPMAQRAAAGYGVYGVKLFDFERPHGQQLVPDHIAQIDPDVVVADDDNVNLGANHHEFVQNVRSHLPPDYSNKTVAVFVLDVRTNKDPWKKHLNKDYAGDFLGERQWQWFEAAMKRSRAAVNVVVQGLQVHGELFPNPNIAEQWGSFPRARQRLFDIILHDEVTSPSILVSGDVHMTQLLRDDCRNMKDPSKPRRVMMEMTTSGMTHSWGTMNNKPVHKRYHRENLLEVLESLVARSYMRLLHTFSPFTNLLDSTNPLTGDTTIDEREDLSPNGGHEGAKQGLQFSLQKNFGELEFDWDERTVTMRTIGEDKFAAPLLSAKMSMDQLSGRADTPGSHLTDDDFQLEASRRHPLVRDSDWVCMHHGGHASPARFMLGHVMTNAVIATVSLLPVFLAINVWKGRPSTRNRNRDQDLPRGNDPFIRRSFLKSHR